MPSSFSSQSASSTPSSGPSSSGRSSGRRSSGSRSGASRSSGHVRIFVVDDHPAIQEALRDTVDEVIDMEIDGQAASAQQALRALQEREPARRPDVVVVDISLGDAHGLDLVETLAGRFPDLAVIVFSMYDEEVYAERAIRAGASGYLQKSEPTETLVTAVRRVEEGEVYLSRQMASRILGKFATGRSAEPRFAIDQLTDREMQVFRMLGRGRSIREIAERLDLSRKTVETHRRRAKEKLDFDSVSELLQYAVQWTYGKEENTLDAEPALEDASVKEQSPEETPQEATANDATARQAPEERAA